MCIIEGEQGSRDDPIDLVTGRRISNLGIRFFEVRLEFDPTKIRIK